MPFWGLHEKLIFSVSEITFVQGAIKELFFFQNFDFSGRNEKAIFSVYKNSLFQIAKKKRDFFPFPKFAYTDRNE